MKPYKLFKKLVKPIARPAYDLILACYGLLQFSFSLSKKREPMTPSAYLAMIRLFCWSRGYSNDFFSFCHAKFQRKVPLQKASGVLGDLDKSKVQLISKELKENGYYVSEYLLPEETIDTLMQYTLCNELNLLGDHCKENEKAFYDPKSPKSAKYILPIELLLQCPAFQNLICDSSILSVAQEYLGCPPTFDVPGLTIATPFGEKQDESAAQMFHFDMDRLKWLKVFFYLSDVTMDNGPHTFIKGSHKSGKIPWKILKKYYSRLTDDEVRKYYDEKDHVVFTGKRGTIILEDTRGLHKGIKPKKGERALLSFQLSNSLAGCALTFQHLFPPKVSANLEHALAHYPGIYRGYHIP